MTVDPHALSGAHGLHALPPAERSAFVDHLARCERCRRELAGFRETAARLGLAANTPPPEHLRETVLAHIRTVRQPSAWWRGRPARLARLTTAAAAVLLVITTTLATLAVHNGQSIADGRAEVVAVAEVLRAPDHLVAHQHELTLVASRVRDRAVLLAGALRPLPKDGSYQVWTVGSAYHSAGLLTPNDNLAITALGDTTRVAVTVEPAGGSPQPTGDPVEVIPMPS